jgi:hypothetical protein
MHVTPRKGRDVRTTLGVNGEKGAGKVANGEAGTIKGHDGKLDLSIFYGMSRPLAQAHRQGATLVPVKRWQISWPVLLLAVG